MSISNINTKGQLNQAQKAQLATAREVKKNVLKTTSRFQSLDETPADLAKDKKDTVLVTRDQQADLPQSMGNKMARLAVGILAPKEEEAKASGTTVAKDGKLETANVVTEGPDGKTSEYKYRKLDDGSEIYHGPTKDGYAVIRENKDGTLMMLESETPNSSGYWDASSWEAPKPQDQQTAAPAPAPPANSEEKAPPQTFAETLRNLASGQTATGPGTIEGRPQPEAVQPPVEEPQASEAAKSEAPEPPAKQPPGFMAPFGSSATETVDKVKEGGENLVKDVGEGLKDAAEKAEETSKGIAQSVKDWSQSDTGQKVGDLLFGIANPWKKKKG